MDFATRKLLGILSGSWLAQALYAVTRLGLPDLLVDGPRTADELATATGAEPRVLYRLLRALAAAGVVKQVAPRTYALSPVSELLVSTAPGAGHLIALMQGEEVFRSFAEIMHTVRTGEPAFAKVYGMPFYAYLDENPAAARTFNESMGGQPVPPALSTMDLGWVGSIVDVGGGNGAALVELLAADPDRRGTLLERPDAIRAAGERLAEAGLADRVTLVEGDFFDGVPAGGDLYLLARVLHNWNDAHVRQILDAVRAAMPAGSRLLVAEELLPDGTDAPAPAGLVDLLMLVTLEGYDRTEAEYRALLDDSGFAVTAVDRAGPHGASGVLTAVVAGGPDD